MVFAACSRLLGLVAWSIFRFSISPELVVVGEGYGCLASRSSVGGFEWSLFRLRGLVSSGLSGVGVVESLLPVAI